MHVQSWLKLANKYHLFDETIKFGVAFRKHAKLFQKTRRYGGIVFVKVLLMTIAVCVHQNVHAGGLECNQHTLHHTGYIENDIPHIVG